MKISKWSIVGILIGLVFAITSLIRYYILYPDFSEAVIGSVIGLLIMCVAWLYGVNLNLSNRILAIEDYLAELNDKENKQSCR